MAADSKIAEALARIEHKVDVAMSMIMFLVMQFPGGAAELSSPQTTEKCSVGSKQHKCPLCSQIVDYEVDINDAIVIRKCGCKTGKIAIDLKAFAPPATPVLNKESNSGEQQEDRRDPDPRRGHRRR